MSDDISSLKLKDLEIFLEVNRAKSIREVARRMNLTPGQISKSIQQLEAKLGTKLYKRSVSGVLPTTQGSELLEIAQDFVDSGERIKQLISGQGKTKLTKTITIASTSFLNTHLTTVAACQYSQHNPNSLFRFLDMAPDQLVPIALRGVFEVAVHYGHIPWPTTWTSEKVGKSKNVLIARADHPLPKKPTLKQVMEYPFVIPTYWTQEGLVRGNDQFPVAVSKRKGGFETATAHAALPIILNTDQLAFVPEILIRADVENKNLRVITCPEIATVERDVYLSVRSDLVSDSMFKGLADRISKNL
jgi:DNA-binding transcriptional LysR family regulator